MRLVCTIIMVFAQNELNSLGWRGHCNQKKVSRGGLKEALIQSSWFFGLKGIMLLVVHYTNYVPRTKKKENVEQCLKFSKSVSFCIFATLKTEFFHVLVKVSCWKRQNIGKWRKWDFLSDFQTLCIEPYLETSRRHQTYLFSNKHRRQKNTYSSSNTHLHNRRNTFWNTAENYKAKSAEKTASKNRRIRPSFVTQCRILPEILPLLKLCERSELVNISQLFHTFSQTKLLTEE